MMVGVMESHAQDGREPQDLRWRGNPLLWAVGAWIIGILLGRQIDGAWGWTIAAVVFAAIGAVICRRFSRTAIAVASMAMICTSAGCGTGAWDPKPYGDW